MVILKTWIYTVLEVGQDEVRWHPVSFQKAQKTIPLPFKSRKIILPPFLQIETIPLLF
jgi:hypothetical protein